jgi:hypothetical protein
MSRRLKRLAPVDPRQAYSPRCARRSRIWRCSCPSPRGACRIPRTKVMPLGRACDDWSGSSRSTKRLPPCLDAIARPVSRSIRASDRGWIPAGEDESACGSARKHSPPRLGTSTKIGAPRRAALVQDADTRATVRGQLPAGSEHQIWSAPASRSVGDDVRGATRRPVRRQQVPRPTRRRKLRLPSPASRSRLPFLS